MSIQWNLYQGIVIWIKELRKRESQGFSEKAFGRNEAEKGNTKLSG
jgi:hypothetical protein